MKRKLQVGVNDLATTHPEIANECSSHDPSQLLSGSSTVVTWVCRLGHTWSAAVVDRTRSSTGCPTCGNRIILPGFNDLATTHPELATQCLDDPTLVGAGSTKVVRWLCDKGHQWSAPLYVRTRKRPAGCPVCKNRVSHQGFNDLATLRPDVARECVNDEDRSLVVGSEVKAEWRCDKGHVWTARVNDRTRGGAGSGCPKCLGRVSKEETLLFEYVKSKCPDATQSVRALIPPLEVDIYMPSKRIAIEYNGVYWHTESQKKSRLHHLNKYLLLKEQGVQLITIWSDDWKSNPELIKRMIDHKLGLSSLPKIAARKTVIDCEVSGAEAESFLSLNHIQGHTGGSVRVGLRHGEELVALAVLKVRSGGWEMVRFATSVVVPGGFTKLVTWLKANGYLPIFTFADHCVSDGSLYINNGWVADKELPPDYKYLYQEKLHHKFGFRKERFRTDPNLMFDPDMTEKQLADLNGVERVWDCGKTRYRLDS